MSRCKALKPCTPVPFLLFFGIANATFPRSCLTGDVQCDGPDGVQSLGRRGERLRCLEDDSHIAGGSNNMHLRRLLADVAISRELDDRTCEMAE